VALYRRVVRGLQPGLLGERPVNDLRVRFRCKALEYGVHVRKPGVEDLSFVWFRQSPHGEAPIDPLPALEVAAADHKDEVQAATVRYLGEIVVEVTDRFEVDVELEPGHRVPVVSPSLDMRGAHHRVASVAVDIEKRLESRRRRLALDTDCLGREGGVTPSQDAGLIRRCALRTADAVEDGEIFGRGEDAPDRLGPGSVIPPRNRAQLIDGRVGGRCPVAAFAAQSPPSRRRHRSHATTASLMSAQGIAARTVMETLGHSDIAVTMNVYTHVLPDAQRDAAARMGRVLWPDGGSLGSELGSKRHAVEGGDQHP